MVQSYRKYKKGVKRLGGKEVATRRQYGVIKKQVAARYGFKTPRTTAIEQLLTKAGVDRKTINNLRGIK